MNQNPEETGWEDEEDLGPSKSARKREAHSLQKLGERLTTLRPDELDQLPLPERLREAIDEAKRLKQRGALHRQRQYIGKLMRDVEIEALEAALEGLTDRHNAHARLRR
jgi:ribosome-associated protein